MQETLFDINRFEIKRGGSQRGEMIDRFLEKLNPPRRASGYKELTPAGLNRLISHIPTEQLYPFFRDCERARNFSKYFFWSIRVDKGC